MKIWFFTFAVLSSNVCNAAIEIYKSTDNTGINKLERIEVIEQYLIKLSGALQTMEAKVDASAIKVKDLDAIVAKIKEKDLQEIYTKLGEKSNPPKTPEMAELERLKADFTAIKNDDIESLRIQIQGLNSSVQSIQGILQTRTK